MASKTPADPRRISTTRLFPELRCATPVTVPLSILDATAGRFSPTGAIWFYDTSPIPESQSLEERTDRKGTDEEGTEKVISRLRSSFIATLGHFPQWAGQLRMAQQQQQYLKRDTSSPPDPAHTNRFNRVKLTYGTPEDPGVEWTVVKLDTLPPGTIPPTPEERASQVFWIGDGFWEDLFTPTNPLALHDLHEYEGLPGMQVQVTHFPIGYAVAVRLSHLLADAQSLLVFMNRWSAHARGLQPSGPKPVFGPSLLDAAAAGDIDAAEPDPGVIQEARSLPLHRFDWFTMENPTAATESSKPPGSDKMTLSPGLEMPWDTWDTTKPVCYSLLHLSRHEVESIRAHTVAALDAINPDTQPPRISELDAVLAHLWAAITRARQLSSSDEPVYLNLSVGVRTRTCPPLPPTFLGSPLFNMHVKSSGSETASSPASTAARIRQTAARFTPAAIGAMLHDAAFEVSPQRLWQAFLGERHLLVTSWARLDVYDVVFERGLDGGRVRPRYVHAVMPKMDGLVQVMDAGMGEEEGGGVDVAVYLERESMRRLSGDGELRRYR